MAEAQKTCETCGATFSNSPRYSAAQWARRRFCSHPCRRFPNRIKRDAREVFAAYVLPDPNSGCWLWTGTQGPVHGYGQVKINGVLHAAHRLSYELNIGPIPDGLFVLHKCDNRLCVNPDHLYAGTQAENLRDMVERGRSLTGERNHATKLTVHAVRTIRASTLSNTEIARRFGVTRQAIASVRAGRAWRHV